MPHNSFLLVQGPPGTGKTTTITGMISQILKRGQKIHLCAPSNTAVDEIVNRIREKGLQGIAEHKLTEIIVRVGASSYDAPEDLIPYDLGYKCQKLANEERMAELEQQIA